MLLTFVKRWTELIRLVGLSSSHLSWTVTFAWKASCFLNRKDLHKLGWAVGVWAIAFTKPATAQDRGDFDDVIAYSVCIWEEKL